MLFAMRGPVLDDYLQTSGGSKGAEGRAPARQSRFFQFHAVFGKFWQTRMVGAPEGWSPHFGEILEPPLKSAPRSFAPVTIAGFSMNKEQHEVNRRNFFRKKHVYEVYILGCYLPAGSPFLI